MNQNIKKVAIWTAVGVVVVGGVLLYLKLSEQESLEQKLSKQGFRCGRCNDAGIRICTNSKGEKRKINCGLTPEIY